MDRSKPNIKTGYQIMHGRAVIIQELDEPVKVKPHDIECNWYYHFVVIELGRIEEKKAWLWDGLVEN